MKKIIVLVTVLSSFFFLFFPTYAQDDSEVENQKQSNQVYSDINFSVGIYQNGLAGALAYSRLYPIAFKKCFYLGYGVRFTSYFGNNGNFVTAPASVSEGNFFKAQNKEKLDTLFISTAQINSLNAAIFLMYKFSNKFSIGFNIDAIGFSFGQDQESVFYSYSENIPVTTSNASVTNFNLLLTGDYDIGSLNSEFYAHYDASKEIAIRVGVNFLFSEYTTDQSFAFDNDRFRQKSLGLMVGVTIRM